MVASLYAATSVPYQSVYGACKAFLASFFRALATEAGAHGVSVTTVCPGLTRTGFRAKLGGGNSGMDPRVVAETAWRASLAGRRLSVPGLLNKFIYLAARLMPQAIFLPVLGAVNRRRGVSRLKRERAG